MKEYIFLGIRYTLLITKGNEWLTSRKHAISSALKTVFAPGQV